MRRPRRSGSAPTPARSVARWYRSAAACAAAGIALAAALPFYSDGPPPAHTGGFGEPTCLACHADHTINAGGGALSVTGLPARYAPGDTYRVTVTLHRGGMRRAGFQLSARLESGESAGLLRALDSAVVVTSGPRGVTYAHQTQVGSRLARADSARWTLAWTASERAGGPVLIHVAANAANDDASEFGDFIYTIAARVAARD